MFDSIIKGFEWVYNKLKNGFLDLFDIDLDNYDPKYQWSLEDINSYTPNMNIAFEREEYFSNKITNLFTNTKVNIIKQRSRSCSTYNIPGVLNPSMIREGAFAGATLINIILVLFNVFPSISIFILLLIQRLPSIKNSVTDYSTYNTNDVTIDETTGKINCSLPETTIFVSSMIFDKFEEDEIVAIILHDIGENTQTSAWVLSSMATLPLVTLWLKLNQQVNIIRETKESDRAPMDPLVETLVTNGIALSLLFFMIFFIVRYIKRKVDYDADTFAIKCGYGEALQSAITRLQAYNQTKNSFASIFNTDSILLIILRIFFKLLLALTKFITWSVIAPDKPFNSDRRDFIKKKTLEYNNGEL